MPPGRAAPQRDTISGMHILLNGDTRDVAARTTVAALLEQAGFAGRKVAVEVNLEVVPRGRHGERELVEGDRVEIIHAIGGG
jgi:sulfur carrier protein